MHKNKNEKQIRDDVHLWNVCASQAVPAHIAATKTRENLSPRIIDVVQCYKKALRIKSLPSNLSRTEMLTDTMRSNQTPNNMRVTVRNEKKPKNNNKHKRRKKKNLHKRSTRIQSRYRSTKKLLTCAEEKSKTMALKNIHKKATKRIRKRKHKFKKLDENFLRFGCSPLGFRKEFSTSDHNNTSRNLHQGTQTFFRRIDPSSHEENHETINENNWCDVMTTEATQTQTISDDDLNCFSGRHVAPKPFLLLSRENEEEEKEAINSLGSWAGSINSINQSAAADDNTAAGGIDTGSEAQRIKTTAIIRSTSPTSQRQHTINTDAEADAPNKINARINFGSARFQNLFMQSVGAMDGDLKLKVDVNQMLRRRHSGPSKKCWWIRLNEK